MSKKRYCYNCGFYTRGRLGRCTMCGMWFSSERTLAVVLVVVAVVAVLAVVTYLSK